MAMSFIESIGQFTIFLKLVDVTHDKSKVKKLSVSLSSISELYDIAMERFHDELADSSIELYIEDKEFSVYCELEDIEQLYHGCIIGIHTKKKIHYNIDDDFIPNTTPTPTSTLFTIDDDNHNDNDNTTQFKVENNKNDNNNNNNPSYAEIVQNGSSVSSTISTTINNSPQQSMNKYIGNKNKNKNRNKNKIYEEDESECEYEYEYEFIYFQEKEFYDNYKIPLNKYYILLTGVPFNATNENIISFFNNLEIESIFFVINYQRNRIGHVYVVFDKECDYNLSFKKHNEYIGDRYIQIIDGDLNEFEKCVKISKGIKNEMNLFNQERNDNDIIIKLKGFSFDINEKEIKKWLKTELNINFDLYSIFIIYDYRNRNSGLSFLKFKNRYYAQSVFKLNHKYLGFRYIQVIQTQLNELRLSLAQMIGSPLPLNLNPYLNCLRMEGLPKYAKHDDIYLYFNQIIGVNAKQLYIKSSLGIAYIEFKSQIDCQLALTRNETYIHFIHSKKKKKRKKYLIRLILCSKYELRSVVGEVLNEIKEEHNDIEHNYHNNDIINIDQDKLEIQQENIDFSREFKNFHMHTNINNDDNDHNDHQNKVNHDSRINKENKENQKFDWHLVSIRGIPFNATRKDIIDFFEGFDSMDPKSIRFIMDHKGRFSGQATVAFFDRHQARSAVNALDRKYIGNRYVLLRLF